MSPAKAQGASDIPEPASASSSATAVSPGERDPMGEIAFKLAEIDGMIETLNAKGATDTGDVPDKQALLRDISKLGGGVNKIKLNQAAQIDAIRGDLQKNTKNEILGSVGDTIQSLIAEEVAAQTKAKMEDWAKKPKAVEFVNALQGTANNNNAVLGEARITLENSVSRHANSTLEIQDDLNTRLKIIKRQDGYVSDIFPISLMELLSYDDERLVGLLKQYDLRPLDKRTENLTRFLVFIGVNQSIPDQVVNLSDEPPSYGNATEARDGKNSKGARGGGPRDAKQDTKPSWPWS